MALANMGLKRPKLVSFWEGEQNVKKKEKRKRKRKKMEEPRSSQGMELWVFGMETHLDYGFYEIWHGSLVLYGYYLSSNLGFVRISS